MKTNPKDQTPHITLGAMAVENAPVRITNWKFWVAVIGSLVLLNVLCTQYAASMLQYQPALGPGWFSLGSPQEPWFRFYAPGSHFVWMAKYFQVAAAAEVWRNVMLLAGLWAVCVMGVVTFYIFTKKTDLGVKDSTLHGSSSFANFGQVQATGLLKNAYSMAARDIAKWNWIAAGLMPGNKDEAKAKADAILDKESAQAKTWDQLEANGKTVDRLPFLRDRQWLALEKKRLEELAKVKSACIVGGLRHPTTKELHPLLDSGGRHILAYAPTGSGKGVALLLPGLMTYQGSVIVHDVKKENYYLTAGARKKYFGHRILLVEPLAEGGISARFNPLAEVRAGFKQEVKDVDSIGIIMCDPDGKQMADPKSSHWVKSALDLWRGAALHVLYTQDNANMGDVLSLLASKPIDELCEELGNFDHAQGRDFYWTRDPRTGERINTHPNVREAFMRLMTKGDSEKGGVKSTLDASLNFFADPVVRDNTSCSDFSIQDITNGPVPVSMYLVAPPTETNKTGPFFSILINLMLNRLTESMAFKNGQSVRPNKHEACFYLDEFPALATIEAIPRALGYTRSYGLRFFLVAQDPSQLKQRYGQEGRDTLFANCNVRVAMTPNDLETAKLISDYLGETTIVETNQSFSGDRISPSLKSTSVSVQKHKRKLLDPSEVMRIPEENLIVFVAGKAPASIWAEKFRYYEDEVFANWAKLQAPEVSERIRLAKAGVDASKFPKTRDAAPPPPKRLRVEDIPVIDDDEFEEAFSEPVPVDEIVSSGKTLDEFFGVEPVAEKAPATDDSFAGGLLDELVGTPSEGITPIMDDDPFAEAPTGDDEDTSFESLFKLKKVLM